MVPTGPGSPDTRISPETNTRWFDNLVTAALDAGVARLILVSFPHVERPTSKDALTTGRLDREPVSVHDRTRLAEEKLLFSRTQRTTTTPVVLRAGMSPLTRDFVRIGRVSYWGDTRRVREELLPTLAHPTLESGRKTLRPTPG